jgi:hypothetical protein
MTMKQEALNVAFGHALIIPLTNNSHVVVSTSDNSVGLREDATARAAAAKLGEERPSFCGRVEEEVGLGHCRCHIFYFHVDVAHSSKASL